MNNQKKRRYCEDVVSDTSIVNFLDRNPILYKQIQLGSYLDDLTEQGKIIFNIDNTGPSTLCISIMTGIKELILKFFPDLKFEDEYGKIDNLTVCERMKDGVRTTKINFWMVGFDDDRAKFFEYTSRSFDRYFLFVTNTTRVLIIK